MGVVLVLGLGLPAGSATAAAPAPATAAPHLAAVAAPAGRLTKLVAQARLQATLGISYLYAGGHGARPAPLNSHVDCSGFVRELYYYAFGTDIGGGSGDGMIRMSGLFVPTSRPVPGDVALFGNGGRAPAYHANIYIGLINGHPAGVGSPQTGENIKIQQWYTGSTAGNLMGYWHYRGATAADSGPVSPVVVSRPPVPTGGLLEGVPTSVASLTVIGWAYDRARPTASNTYLLQLDGRTIFRGRANLNRPDVAAKIHIGAAHGLRLGVAVRAGLHTVCLVSEAVSGSNSRPQRIGCRTVPVASHAMGIIDLLTGGRASVRLAGWSFDPQVPGQANQIRIQVDGRTVSNWLARLSRPDVARVMHIGPNHGFSLGFHVAAGRHRITVISLPSSSGTTARTLVNAVVTAT